MTRLLRPTLFIGVLGPDGVGKTTVIEGLKKYLREQGDLYRCHHWRIQWSHAKSRSMSINTIATSIREYARTGLPPVRIDADGMALISQRLDWNRYIAGLVSIYQKIITHQSAYNNGDPL